MPATPESVWDPAGDPVRGLEADIARTSFRVSAWAHTGPFVEDPAAEPRSFSTYALHQVTAGRLRYRAGERELEGAPDRLLLLPPEVPVRVELAAPGKAALSWVHFEPAPDRPDPLASLDLPAAVAVAAPATARRSMDRLVRLAQATGEGQPWARLRATAELLDLVTRFCAAGLETGTLRATGRTGGPAWLGPVLEAIRHELFSPELTVERLAAIAGLSPGHFARCFRDEVGATPKRYLVERRLARAAARLLEEPATTVADIAGRCGYDDPYHFSRQFKRRYGVAPTGYREGRRGT